LTIAVQREPVRYVDPAELDRDPYPILRQLREDAPVAWVEPARMWFVTRHADVVDVLRDPVRFTTDAAGSTIRDTFGSQMLSAEGDEQRRYKTASAGPFTTRAVRDQAGPIVEGIVARLLDRVAGEGRAELRADLAAPLALETVAVVLGIPEPYHPAIRDWYDAFAASLANFTWDPAIRRRGHEAVAAFRAALGPLLASPSSAPGLLGVLASADPRLLSDDEILRNALIILFGGIETTEATILNAMWALLTHPDVLAEVRDDPALLSAAIEEAMRWEPAVQTCTRHATGDTAVGGVAVSAGDTVQCMIGGANRDPALFADPDRFDPKRANADQHVSFGTGRHFCLGAALARLEARVALGRVLERFSGLSLVAGASGPAGAEFRKPATLPVVWRAHA
jgi:cytochrome P450